MQYSTNLGMSLGQLLAQSAGGGGAFDRGQQVGADIAYKRAATDKLRTDIASNEAELNARSDDSILQSLLSGIGANSEDGQRDLKASIAGTYQPPVKPLAFTDGGTQLPAPEYVSKFPELQQRYAGLKQMLVLGDKNISNLPKFIQGNQRNAITADLGGATPQEAAVIGQRTAALEGNVNPLEMQKAAVLYGLTNGSNSLDAQNALLLSQGKTRYDNMGDSGSIDQLTGLQNLNLIGQTKADENTAKAGQALTAAELNTAKVGQTHSATRLNDANVVLANAKVGQTDSATNLNNANAGLVNAKTVTETNKSKTVNNKPLPTPALKMQQDELESIGTVAGTNADLNTIKSQIEKGTLQLGPFRNFLSGARNTLKMSDEASREYETLKATLERARNASLQLNKGVQTDGDAQRAWNELITNLNDPDVVKKRLTEIVGFNDRAVKLRKAKVNNLRRNYGAEPMDFSEFDSPKTSVQGSGGQGAPTVSNW